MKYIDTIKNYVIEEFLPDVDPAGFDIEYDLLTNGVVDSLGLLKLIAWIEDRFGIEIGDTHLDPDNFRSVTAIDTFVNSVERQAA